MAKNKINFNQVSASMNSFKELALKSNVVKLFSTGDGQVDSPAPGVGTQDIANCNAESYSNEVKLETDLNGASLRCFSTRKRPENKG